MTQEERDAVVSKFLTTDAKDAFGIWIGEFRETYPEIVARFDEEALDFMKAAMFRGVLTGLDFAIRLTE